MEVSLLELLGRAEERTAGSAGPVSLDPWTCVKRDVGLATRQADIQEHAAHLLDLILPPPTASR